MLIMASRRKALQIVMVPFDYYNYNNCNGANNVLESYDSGNEANIF